ncbi:hypothetical protein [Marininema halotolerans]|uniref:Uncharacterized protein n=1 Tax=Marininema halotolerans TaxID=1155944 RepID=A0A1I6UQD3_9BACL|nr:hypothetical protein [Marininema halotolerans]SFT03638.1 hypothetical protein SAMN05444972_1195 [Marininema halotolerans]
MKAKRWDVYDWMKHRTMITGRIPTEEEVAIHFVRYASLGEMMQGILDFRESVRQAR